MTRRTFFGLMGMATAALATQDLAALAEPPAPVGLWMKGQWWTLDRYLATDVLVISPRAWKRVSDQFAGETFERTVGGSVLVPKALINE